MPRTGLVQEVRIWWRFWHQCQQFCLSSTLNWPVSQFLILWMGCSHFFFALQFYGRWKIFGVWQLPTGRQNVFYRILLSRRSCSLSCDLPHLVPNPFFRCNTKSFVLHSTIWVTAAVLLKLGRVGDVNIAQQELRWYPMYVPAQHIYERLFLRLSFHCNVIHCRVFNATTVRWHMFVNIIWLA